MGLARTSGSSFSRVTNTIMHAIMNPIMNVKEIFITNLIMTAIINFITIVTGKITITMDVIKTLLL